MIAWDSDSDAMRSGDLRSSKIPASGLWWMLALLVALNVAFLGGLENEIGPQQQALPALASLLPPEPAGPGHWHDIQDIPLEVAKRLGPWSLTAHYEYEGGGASVIHRLGDQYYRIYTLDGSVYYSTWWGEAWKDFSR